MQSIDIFKMHLDKFWAQQEVMFDWTADLTGTGDHWRNFAAKSGGNMFFGELRRCGPQVEARRPRVVMGFFGEGSEGGSEPLPTS